MEQPTYEAGTFVCSLPSVNRKSHEIRNECEQLNKIDVIKKCISQFIVRAL